MKQVLPVWRVTPAVNAALLVVSAVAFSVGMLEGSASLAARELGYAGQTIRVVAVEGADASGEDRLTRALVRFCDAHGTSVAYSANAESGVVGLYDPAHRYRNRSGALSAPLERAGPVPAAVLSTAFARAVGDRAGLLDDGIMLVGTFSSEVQFDNRYPVVLENLPAVRPGSGTYLIAGLAEGDRDALRLLFAQNGMEVVDLAVHTRVGVGDILSTPYGGTVLAFATLSALATSLVTGIHSVLHRRRLAVAVAAGAAPGDLRRLLLDRLVPLVAVGTGAGVLVVLGVLLFLRPVMQIDAGTIARTAAADLLGCLVLWAVILTWVTRREARRHHRVLPR